MWGQPCIQKISKFVVLSSLCRLRNERTGYVLYRALVFIIVVTRVYSPPYLYLHIIMILCISMLVLILVSRWLWWQTSLLCWGVWSSPRFPSYDGLGQWVWWPCQLLRSGTLWWIWQKVSDGCCYLTSHCALGQDWDLSLITAESCSVTRLSVLSLLCILSSLFAHKSMENCSSNTNHVWSQFKRLSSAKLRGILCTTLSVLASSSL